MRFVLLEHLWCGIHWDLMLEHEGRLTTWAIDAPIVSGKRLPARSLAPHRLHYLDYEGPISNERGEVRRIDCGTYATLVWAEGCVVVHLDGDQLKGQAMFSREAGGGWSFFFEPGNTP